MRLRQTSEKYIKVETPLVWCAPLHTLSEYGGWIYFSQVINPFLQVCSSSSRRWPA